MNAKNKTNKSRNLLARILLILGTSFVALSTTHQILRFRALSLNQETLTTLTAQAEPTSVAHPTHIFIEWFVNVEVDPGSYQEGEWSISPNHATYLVGSGTGKGQEIITLTFSDGGTRDYQVTNLQQVSPTRTDLLSSTDSEQLTLYTCSGLLDSQRFVVTAVPLDQVDAP